MRGSGWGPCAVSAPAISSRRSTMTIRKGRVLVAAVVVAPIIFLGGCSKGSPTVPTTPTPVQLTLKLTVTPTSGVTNTMSVRGDYTVPAELLGDNLQVVLCRPAPECTAWGVRSSEGWQQVTLTAQPGGRVTNINSVVGYISPKSSSPIPSQDEAIVMESINVNVTLQAVGQ